VAEELQVEGCDLITSMSTGVCVLTKAIVSYYKGDNDNASNAGFVQLADRVVKALKNDMCLCSHLRSIIGQDHVGEKYFCDLNKREMQVLVKDLKLCPKSQHLNERVDLSSKIQSEALDWKGQVQPYTQWNPYLLNHLAVQ
jgi:hypothetical protein